MIKRIEIPPTKSLFAACQAAILAAEVTGREIVFEFNGIESVVNYASSPCEVAESINQRMQERNTMAHQQKPDPSDSILTYDVVSAHRLPCSVNLMASICKHAPRGSRVTQRGEWIVVLKPSDTAES